jgi:uncharacterized protein YcbK (DUF882 family)
MKKNIVLFSLVPILLFDMEKTFASASIAQTIVEPKQSTPIDPNTHIQNEQKGKTIPEKIECDEELSKKELNKKECEIADKNLKNNENHEVQKFLNDRVN